MKNIVFPGSLRSFLALVLDALTYVMYISRYLNTSSYLTIRCRGFPFAEESSMSGVDMTPTCHID